jgi:hypothetical protein
LKSSQLFIRYLVTLAGTIAAYVMYAALIVPRIEGQGFDLGIENLQRPIVKGQEVSPDQELLAWLPADSWEHQPCKRLEMDDGILFFQDYQPREGGLVEVFPFTLVLKKTKPAYGPGPDKPESPIIIRASRQAELRFDRPFELGQGSAGKLIECQLQGDVNVYRQQIKGVEGFSIWTRNVQMTPQRVISLDEVRFQIGPHSGLGRNLLMDLEHKTPLNSLNTSFNNIKGIARLELAFVERIRLIPDSREPASPTRQASAEDLRSLASAPIDIVCAGPFVIDFQAQLAEFRDQVEVTRLDQYRDQLHADLLRFHFVEVPKPDAVDEESTSLKLARVQMQGAPARLNLPSESATVSGERLDYDLIKGEVIGNDPQVVRIHHTDKKFASQKIRYTLRADGGLGNLIAEGPGELEQIPTSTGDSEAFHLRWANHLITTDQAGKKLVTVSGNVIAQVNHSTTVSGDKVELWLQENVVTIPSQNGTEPRSKVEYSPIELLVDNQVRIRSPEVDGTTRLLKLIWPAGTQSRLSKTSPIEQVTPRPDSREHRTLRVPTPAPTPHRDPDNSPGNQIPPIGPQTPPPQNRMPPLSASPQQFGVPTSPAPPLLVTGDVITVFLGASPTTTTTAAPRNFERLEIDGNVRINKPNAADPTTIEFKVSGNRLQLTPQGSDLHECQVTGAAHVETPELTIKGESLHLNQRDNRVWVSGAGSLVAHRQSKSTPTQNPAANPPPGMQIADLAQSDQPIHVEWGAGMIFDGEKIYFEQDVRARTEQHNPTQGTKGIMRSTSEGLSLQLNRRIELAKANTQGAQSDISVVHVILTHQIADRAFPKSESRTPPENVVLERTNVDQQNAPFEKQMIIVRHLSVNLPTGDIRGSGPGGIISWRAAGDGSESTKFKLASQNNNDSKQREFPIQYIHANFNERLVANTNQERMLLVGNVRTLYGGVARWDQQLDPESTRVPPDAIRITCDQLDVSRWQPRGAEEPTTELQALGNVRVVSQQFETTSHRLTYDELSDMLTIEGDERNAANLWQKRTPNSQANHLSAGKIRYRPSDEWTSIDGVKKATLRDLRPGN